VRSHEESFQVELAFRDLIGDRFIAYDHATRLLSRQLPTTPNRESRLRQEVALNFPPSPGRTVHALRGECAITVFYALFVATLLATA
jgi:hypothetical protein